MRLLVLALAACARGSLGFVAPGSCLVPCARNTSGLKDRLLLPVSISTQRHQDRLPVSTRSRRRQRRAGLGYEWLTTTEEVKAYWTSLLRQLEQVREAQKQHRDDKTALLAKLGNAASITDMDMSHCTCCSAVQDNDLLTAAMFWAQLRDLHLEQKGGCSVLELDGPFIPRDPTLGSQLLVQDSYNVIFEGILKFQETVKVGGGCSIIIGSPGIGKSAMLYYLMWRIAREGGTVVYDRQDKVNAVLFAPNGVSQGPLSAFTTVLSDRNTWYLMDGKLPLNCSARTVLATSSDRSIWKGPSNRGDSKFWFMGVWSQDEIIDCWSMMYQGKPNCSKQEVLDRLYLFNGTIREVLTKPAQDAQSVNYLKQQKLGIIDDLDITGLQ
ncbi:hypothetical protein JKP88DRAFT_249891 [Tribonema minus]|uniref:Uncharacterized protein n=1 Tax=Tribonema minus TaxID=303371 RepID=A0A836C8L5_9STRA|nr:hypothetical protein JKP88DRAFT_249891 [Tribonema minus]